MTLRRTGAGAGRIAWSAAVLLGIAGSSALSAQQSGPIVNWSPASARFAGLNGAGAALVGYAGTVFTNPAGLATIRHIAVEGAYQVGSLDAYTASGALGWRLGQFDLGFGIRQFDLGADAEQQLASGTSIGPDTTSQVLGVGSLVYRFPLVAVGFSAKYLREFAGPVLQEGTAVDVGFAIAIFDIMALGLSFQNIGGNLRGSEISLPRLTRFGFTMNYVDPQETLRLLSTIEMQWESGIGSRFVLGGEAGVVLGGDAGVVGRVGYASRRLGDAGASLAFGATLELALGKFDLGWQPDDVTGERVRRLGFRLTF